MKNVVRNVGTGMIGSKSTSTAQAGTTMLTTLPACALIANTHTPRTKTAIGTEIMKEASSGLISLWLSCESTVAQLRVDFDAHSGRERTSGGEDEVVAVTVGEGIANRGDRPVMGRPEIDPPHGCGDDETERAQGHEGNHFTVVGEGSEDCVGRGEQAFTEEDDREQPVALRDVLRMPRRRAAEFSDDRNAELDEHQEDEADQRHPLRLNGEPSDPQHLSETDSACVEDRRSPCGTCPP